MIINILLSMIILLLLLIMILLFRLVNISISIIENNHRYFFSKASPLEIDRFFKQIENEFTKDKGVKNDKSKQTTK